MKKSVGPRYLFFLLWPVLVVGILWSLDSVTHGLLDFSTRKWIDIPFLEASWAYAVLHVFTIVPVFALSFDKKVHYYAFWPRLFPAILIMGALFIIWDAFFGYVGVWGFNSRYLLGGRLLGLPWEEWLFFVTVPFGSFFIYACLNAYFPGDPFARFDKSITLFLVALLLFLGIIYVERLYTATTFLLTGGFLMFHYIYVPNTFRTLFYRAYLLILIPFLLVNGVLTGACITSPVVVYNPEEFMGFRIISIPVEDAVYGFLLLFGTVHLYQHFGKKNG
jgi:lycopene cyclase domain-containing protein